MDGNKCRFPKQTKNEVGIKWDVRNQTQVQTSIPIASQKNIFVFFLLMNEKALILPKFNKNIFTFSELKEENVQSFDCASSVLIFSYGRLFIGWFYQNWSEKKESNL